MIVIVDSGSTKTHLVILNSENAFKEYTFAGINPFYQTENEIYSIIQKALCEEPNNGVEAVFHYGAGCSFQEKKQIVKNAWCKLFPCADVCIDSDMLGAAKSLLGNESGIACILGTGANSCLYDGEKIVQNVPPLGFILGDEGSGAYLGGKLVANCMKGLYSSSLIERFYSTYNCTPQTIMDNVYKQPLPNRYLASFVPFISQNIEKEEMMLLVKNSFSSFFERNVMLYELNNQRLGFIGGVAIQFEHILRKVAKEYGFDSIVVAGDPMAGLISYYKKRL